MPREIGCFRFRSLNSCRSRPRPTSGEIGCFRFRSLNSCRSRPRPTSGESGASSKPCASGRTEAVPRSEVSGLLDRPLSAGDDATVNRREEHLPCTLMPQSRAERRRHHCTEGPQAEPPLPILRWRPRGACRLQPSVWPRGLHRFAGRPSSSTAGLYRVRRTPTA